MALSGSSSEFGEDMIREVMLRLPVKSLIRFKCVSRFWHAQITSPDFIAKHLQISKSISCNSRTHMIFREHCFGSREKGACLISRKSRQEEPAVDDAMEIELPLHCGTLQQEKYHWLSMEWFMGSTDTFWVIVFFDFSTEMMGTMPSPPTGSDLYKGDVIVAHDKLALVVHDREKRFQFDVWVMTEYELNVPGMIKTINDLKLNLSHTPANRLGRFKFLDVVSGLVSTSTPKVWFLCSGQREGEPVATSGFYHRHLLRECPAVHDTS
ncbi:hypothetical protein DM860_005831 [Cuscuta australis]|uniref:F-box domain-containing protein n=1 Tax=Cuscuta australis TaxID=267555 RepID=A0A328DRT7_9ASTE|nr:hypothetical protein DM860_005831 [Cuscuta australis]